MADFSNSLNDSMQKKLNSLKLEFGFSQIAFSSLSEPLTVDFYEKWIARDFHGGMAYLKEHLPYKKSPRLLNEKIRSAIAITHDYYPAVQSYQNAVPARVALYAKNIDYHYWLKEKLIRLIEKLRLDYPEALFLPYVDSGPILERDLAYRNGLGWFGKNTCLIHPQKGSLFFIAEILTDLPAETSASIDLLPDFCGKCTRCIDICPTSAITSPREIKADLCISYLTIESKTAPPVQLREKIGDWFFGCDLCQTTCPWNEKVFKISRDPDISLQHNSSIDRRQHEDLIKYFRFLLTESNKKILKYHEGTPLTRAGAKGLKRNALIVIGNKKITELKDCVAQLSTPELRELADWTLERLNAASSTNNLN